MSDESPTPLEMAIHTEEKRVLEEARMAWADWIGTKSEVSTLSPRLAFIRGFMAGKGFDA